MGMRIPQEGTNNKREQLQPPSPYTSHCRTASFSPFTLWLCLKRPRGLPKPECLPMHNPQQSNALRFSDKWGQLHLESVRFRSSPSLPSRTVAALGSPCLLPSVPRRAMGTVQTWSTL